MAVHPANRHSGPAQEAGPVRNLRLVESTPLNPSEIQKGFFEHAEEAGVIWVEGETPFGEKDGAQDRIRRTGFIAINGYLHLIRVSEAHPDHLQAKQATETIVMYPGLTEFVDVGTAKNLHDEVALANPDKRVMSIATDGVSIHGDSLSIKEALTKDIGEIAQERLEIISRILGRDPVTLAGTSMGAIIATYVANHNLALTPQEQINIQGLNFISPGVVACQVNEQDRFRRMPENEITKLLILLRFLCHMGIDPGRETLSRPKDMYKAAKGVGRAALAVFKNPVKGLAIAGNLNAVRPGVPWKIIKNVAENYPIHVYTGSKDPLREEAQWQKLQKLFPDNVTLTLVPRKGHTASVNAKGTAAGSYQS